MKLMIALLLATLPVVSLAQSKSAQASGLPSVAVPKTTEVLVIETPKEGVTFPQVMAVMPQEARATVNLYLDGKIREWYSRGDGKGVILLVEREVRGRGASDCERPAARERAIGG
jgi:hypothetical protein